MTMNTLTIIRKQHGLKQSDIAQVLGVTQQVYSRYEIGVNELPLHHLKKLCEYYQVSADWFLEIGPFKPSSPSASSAPSASSTPFPRKDGDGK